MPADEIQTVDGEDIEIYYIPDERNRYKPEDNVIVLDERLRECPLAHDTIKQHELGHAKAEHSTLLGLLGYELRTDLRRYFSTDPEWQAVREYIRSHNRPTDVRGWIKHGAVGHLRGFWTAALIPLHGVFRGLVRLKELISRGVADGD